MTKKMLRVTFLERIESAFGDITIAMVAKTGGIIYAQGGVHQSESDGRGVSLSSYIHAIHSLVRQSQARSVLMIGCGGGVLGTMLSADGVALTMVDVNPVSPYVARRYFGLPDSVPFHIEDGAGLLGRTKAKYDAIVLDAYHASEIPAHLTGLSFFRSIADHLTKKGALFINVFLQNDEDNDVRRIARTLKEVFPEVRLLDEPGARERNAILMAGDVASLDRPWLTMRPRTGAEDIRADLKRLAFQPLP